MPVAVAASLLLSLGLLALASSDGGAVRDAAASATSLAALSTSWNARHLHARAELQRAGAPAATALAAVLVAFAYLVPAACAVAGAKRTMYVPRHRDRAGPAVLKFCGVVRRRRRARCIRRRIGRGDTAASDGYGGAKAAAGRSDCGAPRRRRRFPHGRRGRVETDRGLPARPPAGPARRASL